MSATAARPNFAFVAASHAGKPADVDRKLIRSHCMKGKNKKRRGQLARPNLIGASYGTQHATLNLLSPITGCVHTIPGIRSPIPLQGTKTQEEEQYVVSSSQATREELFRLEPPPTDLSLVNFAAEVDGQSRALLFKCLPRSSPLVALGSMTDSAPRLRQSKSDRIPCRFLR